MTRLFILHLISNLVTSSSPSSSSELMRFISTLPPSLLETQQIRFTLNILRSIHTFPDPPTLTKLISQQSKPQDRIFLNPALRHFRVIVAIRILKSAYVIAPLEHVIRPWFIANLLPNKEESIITIIKNILEKEKVEIDGERGLAIMKKRSTGQ